MSGCASACCKCYEFIDGGVTDYVRIGDREGGKVFSLASDASQEIKPVADLPAAFDVATAKEVDCSKYDALQEGKEFLDIMSEVDADGNKTGVDVMVFKEPDGSLSYVNMADGSAYDPAADATTSLEPDEDIDWQVAEPQYYCDGVVNVVEQKVYKDGKLHSTTITNMADDSVHTFSGNQKKGLCSQLVDVLVDWGHCFRHKTDPLADDVRGAGIESTIDKSVTPPAVVGTRWIKNDGTTEISQADYDEVKCC